MPVTFSGLSIFITVAGVQYLPDDLSLVKLEVTDVDEGDSEIEIVCLDNQFKLIDNPSFRVGQSVSVKWGYAGGPISTPRNDYILMKPAVHYSRDGVEVTLKAYTKSATLAARRTQKVYGQTSVRQIVKDIANRNGLTLNIKGGYEKLNAFSMASWSDRQALRVLADRYGYQLSFSSNTITFAPIDYGIAPSIELVYGNGESGNIIDAELNVDARKKHGDSSTSASAINPDTKKIVTAGAEEADKTIAISAEDAHTWISKSEASILPKIGVTQIPPNTLTPPPDIKTFITTPDFENVKALATGEMLKKQKKKGELSIKSRGFVNATCRILVTVKGLAKRDSGNWYVASVRHCLDCEEGYVCDFELNRHGNNTKGGVKNTSPLNKQQPSSDDATRPVVAISAETGKVTQ